jgi:UDP-glucose 4-epimerase
MRSGGSIGSSRWQKGAEVRALVTGGAGFIGSNIAALLRRQSFQVRVLDNLSSGHATNLSPEAEFVEGDVRDDTAVDRAVDGCEIVFHLAASVGNSRSLAHPIDDSEINAVGTLRVLEAARRHGVRRLVYSSSAGIFGELRTLPIAEDHPVEPDTPYGASKLAGEKLCLAYGKLYPLETICLRYFNVYGTNQRFDAYGNVIPIFVHRVLAGDPITVFGDGAQTRDLVNVDDVARANVLAATTPGVSGAFNIGNGSRVEINELVRLVFAAAGTSVPIEHGPPRAGDVRHSQADISKAAKAFGYAPSVSLEDGLRRYVAWARSAGV